LVVVGSGVSLGVVCQISDITDVNSDISVGKHGVLADAIPGARHHNNSSARGIGTDVVGNHVLVGSNIYATEVTTERRKPVAAGSEVVSLHGVGWLVDVDQVCRVGNDIAGSSRRSTNGVA
jgi:hypothetical protein